jgi:dUTP pyrophosphatase
MLAAKTGILIKHGVEVGSGIIEPGYDGELKVVLINHDRRAFVVRPGYRVAQLVLQAFSRIEIFQDNLHSES